MIVSILDSTALAKKGATKKCSYIVWSKSNPAARKVVCTSCNTQYCFKCQLAYHAPNSCETIRQWNIKCQDDSETRNYLLVHTQDCPKCKVCIEKNGGCSHMTCNRCKHEICWGMFQSMTFELLIHISIPTLYKKIIICILMRF